MRRHLQWWGAAWVLALLFLASWAGQLLAMRGDIASEGWDYFWAATFENWQSEWLQLLMQAVLILALGHHVFKADKADMEETQRLLREALRRLERLEKR